MKLCINADDYLIHERIDAGIRDAIAAGAVTSVSVMGDADFGPSLDRLHGSGVSVGLHLTLTSGGNRNLPQLSGPAALVASGLRGQLPEPVIRNELAGQYARFVAAYGQRPSHLDCHEHIHAWPSVRRVVDRMAIENGTAYVRVPRDCSPDLSIKKLLLGAAFRARNDGPAFFGMNLMGRSFTWRNIRRQLEYLRKRGIERAVWMVHIGYQGPQRIAGRHDYAFRESEQASLMRHIGKIREYAELVPMERLLQADE